jgi:hypothetical protein
MTHALKFSRVLVTSFIEERAIDQYLGEVYSVELRPSSIGSFENGSSEVR